MNAKVSIIIPNYNKGEFVRHSLDSLMRQTYDEWEAIVVDDCSSDGSWLIIQDYAAKDSRIKAVRNKVNKGGNYSRNLGAKMSHGKYLIFLDSDDWLADDCLENRINEFESGENKEVDMLIFPMMSTKDGKAGSIWHYGDRRNALVSFMRHEIPWTIMMPIWRWSAFERTSGFDESFPRLQDIELHTRALLQGANYKFARRTTPDCFYFIEETRMTVNYEKSVENFIKAVEMYVGKMKKLIVESERTETEKCKLCNALFETQLAAIANIGNSYQKRKIEKVVRNNLNTRIIAINGGGGGMLASMPSSTSWKSTVLKGLTSSTGESGALSKVRILFFVPDGDLATNGVYASQVGGLAKYCESVGAKTMIWDNGMTKKMRFFQVPGHFRRLARRDDRLTAFRPTHIYTRTFASAIAAKELANKTGAKLVYSMRGADVAEALLGRNLRAYIIAAWSWFCVRRAMRLADHVNAVSRTMAEWIWRKFKKRASVLPCCIAQVSGGDLSQRMQRTQSKTIVYSGGMSAWQKIAEIIALMKKISEVDASIRFRFLTKDVDALRQLCASAGLPDSQWSAKSCKPREVAEELSKADSGIILRDDTLVNQVASPIKVGEYLAAGLGIIASPFIGDVGKDLADKEFACMVSENSTVEDIVAFVKGMNETRSKSAVEWAKHHLTYEGNKQAVIEMFS